LSDAADASMQIDRDAAIDMAVYSGNLLNAQQDDRHFWAMTLIAFNLFELVGLGERAHARFISGYEEIIGRKRDNDLTHGWHEGCIARTIRNLFVHGLQTEQRQLKNYDSGERAHVLGVGFIDRSRLLDPPELYHVDLLYDDSFAVRFSPLEIWYYVQHWHTIRRPK